MSFLTPVVDEAEVPVARWMALQAELLAAAAARRDPGASEILRFAGVEPGELDVQAARWAIARDHWYADWADGMAHGTDLVDTRFEAAADAVHDGDLDQLRRLLDEAPALVRQRSPFPHRQTLLHHVAANGIEVERQIHSPANAVEVLRLLLERGAEPDAVCESYGGGNGATALCLLVSSAHPFIAGVQVGLVEELARGGARVDGIDDDCLPLWTAVMSGYTDAAEALVRGGARVDNLCLAAALGYLEAVRGYFGEDGRLRADMPPLARVGATGPALAPERVVDYALIWAAAHGRRAVVEYLLTKDPDLTVREPVFQATALGAARHLGKRSVAALLAPLSPG